MSAGPPSVEGGDLGGLPLPGTASRVRVAVAGPVLCISMDSGLEPCLGCCFPTASEVAAAELPVLSGRRVRNGQQGPAGLGFPGPHARASCRLAWLCGWGRRGVSHCLPTSRSLLSPPTKERRQQGRSSGRHMGPGAFSPGRATCLAAPSPLESSSRIFPLTVHSVPSLCSF